MYPCELDDVNEIGDKKVTGLVRLTVNFMFVEDVGKYRAPAIELVGALQPYTHDQLRIL